MIKAILIDDEVSGLKTLELLLKKYCPEVSIIASSEEAKKAIEFINVHRPDLIFLDINMPHMNGFELLEQLRFKDFQLVFTTAHEEYALKALKRNAVDYLLKPVTGSELKDAVAKVKERIDQNHQSPDLYNLLRELKTSTSRISVNTKYGAEIIILEDILFLEASSGYTEIVRKNDTVLALDPIKEYELSLCVERGNFIRIHNSYIVNVNYIKKYIREETPYVIMDNNRKIPVSRQKKEQLLGILKGNAS